MVESLVITLREGVEAALVVGIILAYLHKTGRRVLNRMIYLGLGAAVAASIAFAILFQALGLDPENEYLEGTLLGIAGILVASLVLWMWRVSRHIKEEMERKLSTIVAKQNLRAQGVGLLIFTFLMVFREGAETVLFLIGATLGKFELLNFIGGATGVGLAVLFAIFFIRGTLRINLSRFFAITSIVLLLLALKLILGSLHEFAEVGVIPMAKEVMAFIGYFVRDSSSTVLLIALLAAPLLVVLWDVRRREVVLPAGEESAVERRKRLATTRQERMWRFGLMLAALFVMFAMASTVLAESSIIDLKPLAVTPANGAVKIPIAELAEGKLAKYVYRSTEADVRLLVLRSADSSISTALDACLLCGAVGYGQEEENAICKNCNAPIAINAIGQGGGCNPLPLAAELDSDAISISVSELAKAEAIFK